MRTKIAAHLSMIRFDNRESARSWVDLQLTSGRQVYRNISEKKFVLFATDILDKNELKLTISKRMSKQFKTPPKLVRITSITALTEKPQRVEGPRIDSPARPLTLPYEKDIARYAKKHGMPEKIVYLGKVYALQGKKR